jgi:hypothetical protein
MPVSVLASSVFELTDFLEVSPKFGLNAMYFHLVTYEA